MDEEQQVMLSALVGTALENELGAVCKFILIIGREDGTMLLNSPMERESVTEILRGVADEVDEGAEARRLQ